jgi:hypothetical protein
MINRLTPVRQRVVRDRKAHTQVCAHQADISNRLLREMCYQARPFSAGTLRRLNVQSFVYDNGQSPSIGITTNLQFMREASRTKACGWNFS